ncbi:hypothetical protein [Burkholderia gladioli]|uniref:hypothetical protein n=1 Tax=Burkholderia gladioli TaxID=28095 RepID=UPI0016422B63|nr:hypothetical protein [Burkholderia gladioli]
MLAGIETLVGGGAAAALGFNAQGAATAVQNCNTVAGCATIKDDTLSGLTCLAIFGPT